MALNDSDITICNQALVKLGAQEISSFEDTNDLARTCSRIYPNLRDSLLASYPWSFSIKKRQLGRLIGTPTNEWKYQFQLPDGLLSGVLAVFASGETSAEPVRYGWEVYNDKVFTNYEQLWIDAQETVDEAKMPPYFVRLLSMAMAAEVAIPVTDQVSKGDYFRALAYGTPGEQGRGGLFRDAMNIDSRGKETAVIEDYSLIGVRG